MKKLLVILLLLSSLFVRAQEQTWNRFYLGINSGINYSRINFESSVNKMFNLQTDQDFESGYGGGIVFIYYAEPNFGLQMELNYSQRGWREDLDFGTFYRRELDYFELPILSHFDIGLKTVNVSITLGPVVSYFRASEETLVLRDEQVKEYYNLAIDNKMEGGLCLGLGLNTMTRFGTFQLECRLNQGLSNMFSDESLGDLSAAQNQVLGIKLSYLFGWSKVKMQARSNISEKT